MTLFPKHLKAFEKQRACTAVSTNIQIVLDLFSSWCLSWLLLASAAVLWDQRWKKAPTFSTAWGAKPPGSHAWICDEPKSQTFKFLVSTPFHPKNEDSNQQVALWLHQLMKSWATLLVLPLHFPAHGPAPGPELQAGDNSGDQLWFPARWHCGTVPQEQFGWQASGLHQI